MAVAQALHEWIPLVIQEVETFMSADSIHSGQRWSGAIAEQLDSTNFGVICTTAKNQTSTWLNFEAGALAKSLHESRVAPLAIDLAPSDIKPPLGQFNGDPLTQDGIRKLMRSMNAAADSPLLQTVLDAAVDAFWPQLESRVSELPEESATAKVSAERSEREILVEVLDTVRDLARAERNPSSASSDEFGGYAVGQVTFRGPTAFERKVRPRVVHLANAGEWSEAADLLAKEIRAFDDSRGFPFLSVLEGQSETMHEAAVRGWLSLVPPLLKSRRKTQVDPRLETEE